MKSMKTDDIVWGIFVVSFFAFMFYLVGYTYYEVKRDKAALPENQLWYNSKVEFKCINTYDNVKRRTDYCEHGWKTEGDLSTGKYSSENPYQACMRRRINEQRVKCHKKMKHDFESK